MKRQVRRGVFETNSSSTHAICIATDTKYNIPDRVDFGFGDFGWSIDKLSSKQERANYLYTCLPYVYNDINKIRECLQFILNTLHSHGVENVYFEDFKISIGSYRDEVDVWVEPDDGYVDHGSEAVDFVNAVCSNEQMLLDYLFSDKTFVLTGNDNDEEDVDINVDYPHEEFYKYN